MNNELTENKLKKLINGSEQFYFLILNNLSHENVQKVSCFFEELIIGSKLVFHEGHLLIFYFNEIEFEISNIVESLSDDIGINIQLFSSPKMDADKYLDFYSIYNSYKKYLANKQNKYFSIVDLVYEIIKINPKDIEPIKTIILSKILADPLNERLVHGMFNSNLNVTKTANEVYMHRNTIIKRLEYIKKETDFNIQKFYDASCMYWLLNIKKS